jgi:hypothetical protein
MGPSGSECSPPPSRRAIVYDGNFCVDLYVIAAQLRVDVRRT